MAKIPFSIEHREKIESGEYKVVTGDGRPVRIISWDKKVSDGRYEIVALVHIPEEDIEKVQLYCTDGTLVATYLNEKLKLIIVTPEPELTPLEDLLSTYLKNDFEYFSTKKWDEKKWNEVMRIQAAELLSIAREQLIKDGYVIEKKAFHDVVENISDKHLAEMSVQYSIHCKVEDGTRHAIMNWDTFQKVAQKFIDIGRAEALKDLPRWKKANGKERFNERMIVLAGDNDLLCTNYAEEGEYYISFSSIEKLPKEDSHE